MLLSPVAAAAIGMSRGFGAHLEESPCLEELPVSPGDATQLFRDSQARSVLSSRHV